MFHIISWKVCLGYLLCIRKHLQFQPVCVSFIPTSVICVWSMQVLPVPQGFSLGTPVSSPSPRTCVVGWSLPWLPCQNVFVLVLTHLCVCRMKLEIRRIEGQRNMPPENRTRRKTMRRKRRSQRKRPITGQRCEPFFCVLFVTVAGLNCAKQRFHWNYPLLLR